MDTLFFISSKLFWFFARPESWILIVLVWSYWALTRKRFARAAKGLLAGTLLVAGFGFLPVGEILLRPLENRFIADPDMDPPIGIIVLGGGEDAGMSQATGMPQLNASGERLTLGLALAQKYPEALLIFTGGSAHVLAERPSGSQGASMLFSAFGISDARVVLEGASRNTAENAVLTFEKLGRPNEGPWVLVTSAFHMPRSMGSFCTAGWKNLIAYPVDHKAAASLEISWDLAGGLDLVNTALKEWIGLGAYAWTGRTPDLLPRGC